MGREQDPFCRHFQGLVWGVICAVAWAGDAHARGDVIPGSRYTSGRGAALGDAFLPLADDGAGGLFYNPAGIGKIRRTQFEPLNFQVQLNNDYIASIDRNFYRVLNLADYKPYLVTYGGKYPGVAGAVTPNFFFRGFAMGILYQNRVAAQAEGSVIRYRSKFQLIPTVGGALRLASGVVRLGYSLQWVNQASGEIEVPDTEDPLGYSQKLFQGSAISHNVGVAVTLPVAYLPSLNVVVRNLFNATYSSFVLLNMAENTQGVPPTEPMSLDLSLSAQPKVGRGASFNLVAEWRDVTNTAGIELLGHLAFGVEFSFRDQFFIRGGWGSGYPSAGLGLKRKNAEFSLSWYSEEVGTRYQGIRDTRFILQYQIRFF